MAEHPSPAVSPSRRRSPARGGVRACVGRGVLASLVVVLGSASSAAALAGQAAPDCGIPEFPAPVLCARAGLDTVPASYLLLVDESGSMAPLWPAVRRALVEFALAVPDGDRLDVRSFAGAVRSRIAASGAEDATRSAWAAAFMELEAPRGARTDLGRAAEAALTYLGAEPPSRPQFIFFLTDGRHDPAADSPYRRADSCTTLAAAARDVVESRPVSVAIVRLSGEADATYLSCVFPRAVVTDAIGPDALRQWFAGRNREAAVAKLRALVHEELRRPVARLAASEPLASRAGRPARRVVELEGTRRVVAAFVATDTALAFPDGGRIELDVGHPLPLAPERVRTELVVAGRPCAVWRPPGGCAQRVAGTWPLRVRLEPAEELRRIGLPREVQDSIRLDLAIAGGGLLSWPAYVGAAAGLLAVLSYLALLLSWKLHRAYLPGRIIVRLGNGPSHAVKFAGQRLRAYVVVTPDGRELLRFDARSERGRTVVYARPGAAARVHVRGQPLRAPQVVAGPRVFECEDGEVRYLEG